MLLGVVTDWLIVASVTALACFAATRLLRRARVSRHRSDAEAALRRHPAGRARQERAAGHLPGTRAPSGPDDDPDFIRTLERLIRGDGRGAES
jgi:hypothetical protein